MREENSKMGKTGTWLACALLLSLLVACGGGVEPAPSLSPNEEVEASAGTLATEADSTADTEVGLATGTAAHTAAESGEGSESRVTGTGTGSMAEALAGNGEAHAAGPAGAWDDSASVLIAAGELTLDSGGGSGGRTDASASAKGIKAAVSITIDNGTFAINSTDDALNSNGSLVINGGTFLISSGDDAMHADAALEIYGGQISITDSFEGLESAAITIDDGEIRVVASDDALNVAGGNDCSGMNMGPGLGGDTGGRPGRDAFASSGNYYLHIAGSFALTGIVTRLGRSSRR